MLVHRQGAGRPTFAMCEKNSAGAFASGKTPASARAPGSCTPGPRFLFSEAFSCGRPCSRAQAALATCSPWAKRERCLACLCDCCLLLVLPGRPSPHPMAGSARGLNVNSQATHVEVLRRRLGFHRLIVSSACDVLHAQGRRPGLHSVLPGWVVFRRSTEVLRSHTRGQTPVLGLQCVLHRGGRACSSNLIRKRAHRHGYRTQP